jgi:hypothetical protein
MISDLTVHPWQKRLGFIIEGIPAPVFKAEHGSSGSNKFDGREMVQRDPFAELLIRFGFAQSNGRHAGVCFGV